MKNKIKILMLYILVLFLPISELSAYNSTILKIIKQENAKEASNKQALNKIISNSYKSKLAFKPFSINEETCELEVGDLDVMLKEIEKQIKTIVKDLKSGGEEYLKAKKNQLLKESLTKLPAYAEFMYIKMDVKIISNIASELTKCTATQTSKGVDNESGGGGGDQGNEMRVGVKPKELMAVVECFSDALFPKDMTDEDTKLLKKLIKKWENLINTLLNTQLNLMIKEIQKPKSTNICTEAAETKSNDLSYLMDNIGSIYLLDNTALSSKVEFEIETEKEYDKRIEDTKTVLEREEEEEKGRIKKNELTEIYFGKEAFSKQPLFIDTEEGKVFSFFKSIVKKYMIDLSNTYGIFLNRETKNYVEIILTKLVFETNETNQKDDFYTLIYKLSENIEFFNKNAENDQDIINRLNIGLDSFDEYSGKVDVQVIRDILNKTLLNAYSRYQKVQANKLNIYYANIPKIFEVNNKHIIQILMVDRYFYRYKKLLQEKYIRKIIYKKELEKKMIIMDFCINRKTELFENLCLEVMKK